MRSLVRGFMHGINGALSRLMRAVAWHWGGNPDFPNSGRRPHRPTLLLVVLLLLAVYCVATVALASNTGRARPTRADSSRIATAIRAHPPTVGPSSGLGWRGPGPTIPAGAQAVTRLFTATSRTYKAADRPYTTIFYGHPVNYRGPKGEWLPIEDAAGKRGVPAPPHIDSSNTFGASKDCPLESASPSTSFCTSTTDYVGYDGTNTDNSLVQFNVKESIPTGAEVLNAQLGMYLYESSTTTGVSVSAYAVSKERPWTTSATWNTYDGTHPWTTAGGDFSTTNPVANPSVTKPAGWAHWYPTQIVQEWVNESGTNKENNGFLLADTTQKTTTNLLSFRSSKASENKPYLTVSWTPRGQEDPPFYSMQSFDLGYRATMKVNLASGDLFVNSTDLAVKGVGIPFLAEHNYDSLDNSGGSVNPWYSLPGAEVYADGSVAIGINHYDFATYILQSNGEFKTPPGMTNATLCKVNGTTCKGNSIDGSKAVYALTFNEPGNGPLYQQGNKIDFGSTGGVWSIADRYGNALAYNYEGGLKIKDTQGRTFTRHTTTVNGFTVTSSWTESGGGTREVKYAYNASGKLETYTDAEGNKTKYTYESGSGLLKEFKDPKGNVTSFNYNSSHQIEKITLPEVGGKHPLWEYHYFAGTDTEHGHKCERLSEEKITKKTLVKDPRGNESTFCANVEDEVLESFDAKGNETTATFDSLAHLTSSTEAAPGGNVESMVYEAEGGSGPIGSLACVVTGIASVQKKCPSSEPNKELLGTLFEYGDKKNEYLPTKATGPQGASVEYCYNDGEEAGCPKTTTGPAGSLQRIKDGLATENEFNFKYNSKGELTESTDARGNATTYEYDEKGNLKKVTPPVGSEEEQILPTKITVDSESRPHVIEDGEGHIETITYDVNDHINEIAFTGTGTSRTVKLEYDTDGNLIKREDPTGTTKYTVDALNRLTKESLPGSLSNEYAYDAASNMESFTDGGGTTKYAYNSLNLLESMTEPGGQVTKFAYDGDDRLTEITYASGAVTKIKPDIVGRPESITFENLSGPTVPNLSYNYEHLGNHTEMIQSVSESTGPKTEYFYDPINRLELEQRHESGSSGQRYAFELDGDGNRKQQVVNLTSWEPEKAGEETTYYHTNADNLLECRQTVTGVCSGNSSTELSHYRYDKAGEELAITPKAETSGSTFAYNAAQETKSITPSGGSEQALAYGGAGQGDLVELGSTKLQNSLLGLTREAASGGTSYFARTPDGLLIDQRTPSGNFNPLFDAQGNVIALVNSSKKVERTFHYGPYGENVESGGEQTVPFVFGFQGGYRVPGGNVGKGKEGKENTVPNGLYHFGERYYDPTVGRWTQQDPIGGGCTFAGDDPINAGDPSGLHACSGWFHLGGANIRFSSRGGRLFWDFFLTNITRELVGPEVTVRLTAASIDRQAINPPYKPHKRPSFYNFHGSLQSYQLLGPGGERGRIESGQVLSLTWTIEGADPLNYASVWTTCRIP
jgi:RHS repeat-associated protein